MGNKVGAIICDMDGTAVQYPNGIFSSSWDMLAELLPEEQQKEWYALGEKYYGNGNYKKWFKAQVLLLKGKKFSDAERFLFPVPYSPGFREFFSSSDGLKKAILSAGIDFVARRIAEEFDFDYYISQCLEVKDGIFTGSGKRVVNAEDKSKHLPELSKILNVPLARICYVGDTEGDISCLEKVGFPVAFNPHHGLEEYVRKSGIPKISNFMQLKSIIPC